MNSRCEALPQDPEDRIDYIEEHSGSYVDDFVHEHEAEYLLAWFENDLLDSEKLDAIRAYYQSKHSAEESCGLTGLRQSREDFCKEHPYFYDYAEKRISENDYNE